MDGEPAPDKLRHKCTRRTPTHRRLPLEHGRGTNFRSGCRHKSGPHRHRPSQTAHESGPANAKGPEPPSRLAKGWKQKVSILRSHPSGSNGRIRTGETSLGCCVCVGGPLWTELGAWEFGSRPPCDDSVRFCICTCNPDQGGTPAARTSPQETDLPRSQVRIYAPSTSTDDWLAHCLVTQNQDPQRVKLLSR